MSRQWQGCSTAEEGGRETEKAGGCQYLRTCCAALSTAELQCKRAPVRAPQSLHDGPVFSELLKWGGVGEDTLGGLGSELNEKQWCTHNGASVWHQCYGHSRACLRRSFLAKLHLCVTFVHVRAILSCWEATGTWVSLTELCPLNIVFSVHNSILVSFRLCSLAPLMMAQTQNLLKPEEQCRHPTVLASPFFTRVKTHTYTHLTVTQSLGNAY